MSRARATEPSAIVSKRGPPHFLKLAFGFFYQFPMQFHQIGMKGFSYVRSLKTGEKSGVYVGKIGNLALAVLID